MIRNIYLVLIPISGTELLNHLEFLKGWAQSRSFYCVRGDFGEAPGWGLVAWGPNLVIRGLPFSVPSSTSLWRKGLEVESVTSLNHARLCNKASIETQRTGLESFRVREHVETQEQGCVWREHVKAPCPFSKSCSMHLYYLALPELYPLIIN